MATKFKMKIEKEVTAKILKFHIKARDEGSYTLVGDDGTVLKEKDSAYVPDFFPGTHYGDYVELDIDLETGTITNWTPPTAQQLKEFVDGKAEE